MSKVRIIPVLLLRDWGLEKSIQFERPVYVGSPINAARIFSGRNADELILLDIAATPQGRGPNVEIVSQIAQQAFMPLVVGGGVRDLETIRRLLECGADRVALNTAAVEDPALIRRAADKFGSQCIVVSIDARRRDDGSHQVVTRGGMQSTGLEPAAWALEMQRQGAGEILLTSVDRDGTMEGYDLALIRSVTEGLSIPLIACGGAGSVADLARGVHEGGASAVAAGALFLFFGPRRTVLITYPSDDELLEHFDAAEIRDKRANPVVAWTGTCT